MEQCICTLIGQKFRGYCGAWQVGLVPARAQLALIGWPYLYFYQLQQYEGLN
jgi:hypothetical protein